MKKHFSRALALLLALVMVISVLPVMALAVDEGSSAGFMSGLPADGSSGVIYNADGYVMGFDLNKGKAPAKSVSLTADGSGIASLPNGTAVVKFVKTGDDYYFVIGGKYLTVKDLDDSNKEKLVLTESVETGSKWRFAADQGNAAGYWNILNVEYKYNGNDVYLEQYTNYGNSTFSPYSYKASTPTLFQMKIAATEADEDGRVGEIMEAGDLPADGAKVVVYNDNAKAVFGQPTGADAPAPALTAAAAVLNEDGTLSYENIADGGMIFTVHTGSTDGAAWYSFENNGKFLAMPENTVDENGKVNNDETLLMIEEPADAEKLGYIHWTMTEISGGYVMYNVAARYGTSKCCVEFFNDQFSGWTYKAATPELFAMNFFPMEDKDGVGYVVNPTLELKDPDPAVGSDCPVEFEIHDVSDPVEIFAQYMVTDQNDTAQTPKQVEPELVGRKGSFTIPAADLENGKAVAIEIGITDALGKTMHIIKTFQVRDEPLILTSFPAANSATGDEKKPEISVTFANVKENAAFEMLLDGEAVSAAVEGSKLSFVPAEDLADGKHTVSVTITRADGKSVNKTWNFFVGEGGETLYFGQIHSHTSEYSDGAGTLEDAYEHAHGVADLDYIVVTDHSNYFDTTATATTSSYYNLSSLLKNAAGTTTKWEEARATAKQYNELYDDFICMYGYEMTWSGGPGHTNTFNTYGVVSRNNAELNNKTGYAGMHRYNDLMVNAEKGLDIEGNEAKTTRDGAEVTGVNATKYIPFDADGKAVPVVSQFNHPGKTFGNFDNYAGYSAKRDDVLNLIEVGNGEGKVGGSSYFPSYSEYDLCLSMGWHVGPTNNQDNHKGNWGDSNTCRDVVLTDDFSEIGIYRALDARRIYSTEDQNLRISYELVANGETYKLGEIAPIEESEQPETVTVKVEVSDPDRTDNLASVEVIGEGGKTLYKETLDSTVYTASIELPNTDSYYYVRVVEADGQIAVTAPVWVKEAVPVAADVESSASVAAQGEEENIIATLTNGSESEPLTLTGYKVEAEDRVLEEQTGLEETVEAGAVKTLTVPFTPSATEPSAKKTYEIKVTFNVIFKGKELTYSKTISETSYPPELMTYVGLDKGHMNFYVSGDYAGNEGNFLQICAERGIICQYIEAGQMTKENLAKYKAVFITVPRIKGDGYPPVFTDDELDALADYAAKGGNIVNLSKSDRYDPADPADAPMEHYYSSANLSNMINEAVGAKTRFARGIVVDNDKKANEAYRISFDGKELLGEHPFTEGIFASSNGQYQWYNGTGIVEAVIDEDDPCLPFEDVNRSAWYHEAVDYVLAHGIMIGMSSTKFGPNVTLSREMFLTMLWRIAGSPNASVDNPFTDISAKNYSYKAVLWAYENGITTGRSSTSFVPKADVTRQEMATFLFKFAKYLEMDVSAEADLSAFPDAAQVSAYAKAAMKWAVGAGLINGVGQNDGSSLLQPKGNATRAQAAALLMRFLEPAKRGPHKDAESEVIPLVKPYDSSWIACYTDNFTGSSYEPNYETDTVVAEKGTFNLVTFETLAGGGFLICGGACFISNYDLKYGTAANEQYENYGMVCNILDYIKDGPFDGEITPIAEVHNGEVGQEFTVEGVVTSNASDFDKDTAFFDCIYVQDETRGINCFPVSGYYFIGQQVRVHGGVTYYCGEIELNLSTDYNGSIKVISNEITPVEPAAVSCAEAMSDDNIGNLMKVTGVITEIHETAGVIDKIYVDDGSGEQAMFFINAYIQKESTALNGAKVGMMIEGVGIGSRDVDEESGGADGAVVVDDPSLYIKRLRVRARDELLIWGAELDTAELEAAIAEAEALDPALYTEETMAAVTEALAAAQAVMANPDKTQREVTEAYNALRAALDALELKPEEPEPPAPDAEYRYVLTDAVANEDKIVIYHPAQGKALNDTLNGKKLDGVDVTAADGLLTPAEGMALYTVEYPEGDTTNFYLKMEDGKYLTSQPTGNGLSLEAEANEYSLWYLVAKDTAASTFFIYNTNAAFNGNKNQALEYYKGYTTYGWKDNDAYIFQIYKQVKVEYGYQLKGELKQNDKAIIYHPAQGKALNDTLNGKKLDGVDVTVEGEVLTPAEGTAIYTVEYPEGDTTNFYLKMEDGKYLTSQPTGNGLSFEETANEYSLWYLAAKDAAASTFFIYNTNAAFNGNKNQALEYYKGYTTYGWKDNDAYVFQVYVYGELGAETAPAEVNTASLEAVIAEALAIDANLYTEESVAAMNAALAAAQAVLADEEKTQAQVNEAAAALRAAIDALVRVPAPDADVYELVTEAPADWSGTYLFASVDNGTTYVFNGKEEVNGHVVTTVTDNRISFIEGMEPVVIAAMEGGYSLHVTEGYMYGTPSANGLKFASDAKLATLEMNEDGSVCITSDTTIFRFNNSDSQLRFRFYKPTSGTSMPMVRLYKLVED